MLLQNAIIQIIHSIVVAPKMTIANFRAGHGNRWSDALLLLLLGNELLSVVVMSSWLIVADGDSLGEEVSSTRDDGIRLGVVDGTTALQFGIGRHTGGVLVSLLTATVGLAAIDGGGKNTFAGGFESVGWNDAVGTSRTGDAVVP